MYAVFVKVLNFVVYECVYDLFLLCFRGNEAVFWIEPWQISFCFLDQICIKYRI